MDASLELDEKVSVSGREPYRSVPVAVCVNQVSLGRILYTHIQDEDINGLGFVTPEIDYTMESRRYYSLMGSRSISSIHRRDKAFKDVAHNSVKLGN